MVFQSHGDFVGKASENRLGVPNKGQAGPTNEWGPSPTSAKAPLDCNLPIKGGPGAALARRLGTPLVTRVARAPALRRFFTRPCRRRGTGCYRSARKGRRKRGTPPWPTTKKTQCRPSAKPRSPAAPPRCHRGPYRRTPARSAAQRPWHEGARMRGQRPPQQQRHAAVATGWRGAWGRAWGSAWHGAGRAANGSGSGRGKRGGGKHGWRRGERENGQNNAQGFTPPSRGEAGGAVARLSRRREGLLRHTRMDEGEKLAPAAAPLCGTGGIGSGVPTGMWAEPRARGARSRAGPRAATCDPEAGHISSPCPTTRPRWET